MTKSELTIINNPIKKLLNENGYMLNRNKTKNFDGQFLYNVEKVDLVGIRRIAQLTRIGLTDAYEKGVLIQMLDDLENQA